MTEITKINNKYLLTQYGTISIEDFKKEATNYLERDSNNKLVLTKKGTNVSTIAYVHSSFH